MSTIDTMLVQDALRSVDRALEALKDTGGIEAFKAQLNLINAQAMLRAALVGNEPTENF